MNAPSIRLGVITGLIVWLISTLLFQPLLKLLGSRLLPIGPSIVSSLIDSIYREAALGNRNDAGALILVLLAGGAFGVTIALTEAAVVASIRRGHADASPPQKVARPTFVLSRLSTILTASVFALALGWFGITETITLNLNISFQQRLTILAPFLTNREESELRAEWASMRGRRNFDELNKRLAQYAKSHGILFPQALPGY